MTSTNRLIVAMLAVAALAVALLDRLLLAPKREEASKLGAKVERAEGLAGPAPSRKWPTRSKPARASPTDYQQLVVLGKAVPGDDDTASLLVQLNRIADAPESSSETSS